MNNKQEIIESITNLVIEGESLLTEVYEKKSFAKKDFCNYEIWYTKALSVINQILPERKHDFVYCYKQENRKEIKKDNFTVSDYLNDFQLTYIDVTGKFDPRISFKNRFLNQIAILSSAKELSVSVLHDIKGVFRAEIFDNDLLAAAELLKANHIRSAGAICGVILESHLKEILKLHGLNPTKKNLCLGDLNEILKNNTIYDLVLWRKIQHLSDIRNLCSHKKDREPTKEEVEELMSGVKMIIKTVA